MYCGSNNARSGISDGYVLLFGAALDSNVSMGHPFTKDGQLKTQGIYRSFKGQYYLDDFLIY